MKNSTLSTSSTIATTEPFSLTRSFLAMPDMRGMVKAFLLLIIPCVVLMYFTLETNSSYDTPLGFATALICTFAFVPTFVVIGMLFCIVVDYIVLVVRILMEFMGFTGQQRS